jgi:hypothetical protein
MSWFADVGGCVEAAKRGAVFKWRCHHDCRFVPVDLNEILARCGPTYSLHNEIGVCQKCGAPMTIMKSPSNGTPMTPMKDEWLWLCHEIGYGRDPEAWFEIEFMEPEGLRHPKRR